MKIAQITCVWPPYGGGVGMVASEQARNLVKLGHQVTVFTPAYHGQKAGAINYQGVRVVFLKPLLSFGNAAWLPQLFSLLKDFDLIHLHLYFIGATSYVLRAAKQYHKPLVAQYHNDLLGWGWRKIFFRLYTALMLPKIIKTASHILGLSSAHIASSDLRKYLTKLNRQADILPNGVDIQHFSPGLPEPDLQQSLELTNNDQVLLFVGGLDQAHYFKGLFYLLKSLVEVVKKFPQVKLLIAGDGDNKPVFVQQTKALGISDRVKFLGLVKQTELPRYYRLAKMLILPSIAVEAFPVVVLEALACGLPVVTTTLPGPANLVGEAGVTVKPKQPQLLAQAITDLLADEKRRLLLSQAARNRVENNFNWSQVIISLDKIYRS